MLAGFGKRLEGVFARVLPDPFVIAVGLTALTAIIAIVFGSFHVTDATGASVPAQGIAQRSLALLDAWRGTSGLWKFLGFAMQMCLVLVTGYALAESPPVRFIVRGVARLPRTGPQAAAIVALVACTAGLVNWGLGLIVGALLARDVGRELARRSVPHHMPILAAAGYTGMLVWHGGLSGTAPFKSVSVAEARTVLHDSKVHLVGDGIPLSETALGPLNLVTMLGLVVIAVGTLWLLSPRNGAHTGPGPASNDDQTRAPTPTGSDRLGSDPVRPEPIKSLPAWLEHTRWVSLALGVVLLIAAARGAAESGITRVNLNDINAAMLGLGLVLHPSIGAYTRVALDAAKSCAGIILQFPLYAGIMGMLVASGLITTFSAWLAGAGGPTLTPVLTFISAGIVNLFVPSGGGQWGIQGPIALEAGAAAQIDPGVMVMAVAYGDQLTNMLQPFWALPLLAITGVKARELVGYTAVVMVIAGVWCAACLIVLPAVFA